MMEHWNAGMMGEERIKNTEARRQNKEKRKPRTRGKNCY
jgi:hypothetical protein